LLKTALRELKHINKEAVVDLATSSELTTILRAAKNKFFIKTFCLIVLVLKTASFQICLDIMPFYSYERF